MASSVWVGFKIFLSRYNRQTKAQMPARRTSLFLRLRAKQKIARTSIETNAKSPPTLCVLSKAKNPSPTVHPPNFFHLPWPST